jgi:uncharacterized protein
MNSESRADAVIRHLKLQPLPVEGGLFRRTWQSHTSIGQRPAGTCIFAMFTADEDSFSAMHRLPYDEIWHFYTGDPVDLLLLHPDGSSEHIVFGSDILNSQRCQVVVAAGTWMGAGLLPGGEFALFGCTMSPGFTPESYDGGDRDALIDQYPHERATVTRFTRLNALSRCMPSGY